eukprot:551502_1
MSVDRACILLLSTKTWDLSGGRKGGFQSYREPLSIFELITAVFLLLLYILSFSNKRIDLISFYWFKIGSIIKIKTKLYIHHSLVQHHMVYLIGESSLHQFELFKSFNGSDIYLTASVGIVHEDLDRVFTVKGNGNGIYSIESFDGPIMLLSTPNGLHAYSHIKNKKYNLKQLKKLINSLKINGPAPRLDLVTIYFQMKKIKTSFNILVRIGGPYPSHMKLVTTISLLLYVLIRFECKNTISKNYNNITGPTNAALTVVTSNIITNNCIIQRNGLIIYVDMFLISYVRNIIELTKSCIIYYIIIYIFIYVISTMKNRLRCEKSTFLISGVRNITNVTILYIYSLIKWVIMLFRIQKSLKQITETIQFS